MFAVGSLALMPNASLRFDKHGSCVTQEAVAQIGRLEAGTQAPGVSSGEGGGRFKQTGEGGQFRIIWYSNNPMLQVQNIS